ncbi:hypothetical protein MNEG_13172 [Monoraphidium neglectum]|uniref:Prefoldin subunit 5 n=1 Tax=Monoraphidium neglectum TaxID=145388 RepID=A0A0D2LT32_9CHLO|nr:hypothetical protein MNEG_13172 [Monoraphidium neglectum]KIY94789.1 hypothetical protein MNEG_13172 [Monoraphidium neglectum]|eukprot:XP_013893809.1 hypothetical protein MNEG_13172 [Monoraphidium neglectum]
MAAAAAAPGGGRARALSAQELQSKVLDYESFVEDVLKKKLAAIGRRRAALEAEREELAELRRGVLALQAVRGRLGTRAGREGRRELKSLVDLGSGVFCQARVPDASRLFVAVGLGFHVECTLEEAAQLAERRREALQARFACVCPHAKVDECIDDAAQVRAHIRFVAQAIGELQQLGR